MSPTSCTLHATSVKLHGLGVLIIGKPGSGKSSLALQLLDLHGATLISDDQTQVTIRGKKLFATAPRAIKNSLEIRGWGIVNVKASEKPVPLGLIVELVESEAIERHPDIQHRLVEIIGVPLPRLRLDAKFPAAASRISFLARHLKQA
jgi:HPr kinase/phosphorylase